MSISLLSPVEKINGGTLVDRVCKVTEEQFDSNQKGFRPGQACVDKVFPFKQLG